MTESPFHQTMHKFILAHPSKPIFHIDIHGKFDRKADFDLDLGVSCLHRVWKGRENPEFVEMLVRTLT